MNSSNLIQSPLNTSGSVPYSHVDAAAGWAMIFICGASYTRGGGGGMLTPMAAACCTRWR